MPGTGPFARVHNCLCFRAYDQSAYRAGWLVPALWQPWPFIPNYVDSDVHRDRIRPPRQALKVDERYTKADRWRILSGPEKLQALRKARKAVAAQKRIPESRVSTEAMAHHLGIPERWCRGFVLTLAGDFT